MPIAPNQLKFLSPTTKLLIQEIAKKPPKKPNHPGYSGNFRSKWITGRDYRPSTSEEVKIVPF